MATPIISTAGLTHSYGEIRALDGISVDVPAGTVGLVGANGAGKTTLLKLLLGILEPETGDATVLGHEVANEAVAIRAQVGFMPEAACLPRDQTAADFVSYAAELAGLPAKAARQRASDVLTLVGLHEERFRYLGEFSTGMQQRAKIAQALVHDPSLVLLDEPTAGLDPAGRDEMLDLISRLGTFGINAVVSSHVLTDIERTCDWVVMLDRGKLLRSAPLDQLEQIEAVEVELFDGAEDVAAALTARGADVSANGLRLRVRADGDPYLLIRDVLVSTGAGLRRMRSAATTLEDIFLQEGEEHD